MKTTLKNGTITRFRAKTAIITHSSALRREQTVATSAENSSQHLDDEGEISKTRKKAEADALQALGVTLTALPKDKLLKLNLPEKLYEAILEAKRITANGAIRRQRQYIGSLMRNIDASPIIAQLEKWDGKNQEENARFHQLERWRDRLLQQDQALNQFIAEYPQTDIQQVRTLIRNAKRELEANKPPKSSRELFKLLRTITEQDIEPNETETQLEENTPRLDDD